MADPADEPSDASDDLETGGVPDPAPPKASSKGKESAPDGAGAPHLILRIALGASGLLLIVGFFLEWVQLMNAERELIWVSGLQLATNGQNLVPAAFAEGTQWWVLFFIPVFGAALTAVGFLGFRWSGIIGAVLGLLVVGYGAVTVMMIFISNTNVGLWLVLGGAVMSVACGTIAFAQAKNAKPKKPKAALAER